jgi:hypothetical protein
MSDEEAQQLATSIAALVMVVAEALLNVASKTTEPADRVACLQAARHAGHVHSLLR